MDFDIGSVVNVYKFTGSAKGVVLDYLKNEYQVMYLEKGVKGKMEWISRRILEPCYDINSMLIENESLSYMGDPEKEILPKFTVTIFGNEHNDVRIVESGGTGVVAVANGNNFSSAVHKAMDDFLIKKLSRENNFEEDN